jgi:hypothetical protein
VVPHDFLAHLCDENGECNIVNEVYTMPNWYVPSDTNSDTDSVPDLISNSDTDSVPDLISNSDDSGTETESDENEGVGFLFRKNTGNIPMGTNVSPYIINLVRRTSSGLWIKIEDEESKKIALKAQQEYVLHSLKEKFETHITSQFSTVNDLYDTFFAYHQCLSLQFLYVNMLYTFPSFGKL